VKRGKSPLLSWPFHLFLHPAYNTSCFHPCLLPSCAPHRSTIHLNFVCSLVLSIPLLLFLRAWWMIAERKVELDASFTELSFETCRRFCLAGVSRYSSLARRHPKHQLSVTASHKSSSVNKASPGPIHTHTHTHTHTQGWTQEQTQHRYMKRKNSFCIDELRGESTVNPV